MSARWATRDYQRTSSLSQMIRDLNWRTLEQRRIDSQLTLTYKITYDLVAISAANYIIPNTRQSRQNHQLAYRQIPTLKDYYKYTFFPHTIVHWNALPFYIPVLPTCTVAQFSHAVCQYQRCFYLLTKLTPPLHLYTFSSPLLFNSPPPPCTCVPNPVWCPPRRLRRMGRKKETMISFQMTHEWKIRN